jgi:hypothetical protein
VILLMNTELTLPNSAHVIQDIMKTQPHYNVHYVTILVNLVSKESNVKHVKV